MDKNPMFGQVRFKIQIPIWCASCMHLIYVGYKRTGLHSTSKMNVQIQEHTKVVSRKAQLQSTHILKIRKYLMFEST